ncbi:MAG: ergothioneine biosynthesis protein EgtC [Gammaproteobacteria bacterium]
MKINGVRAIHSITMCRLVAYSGPPLLLKRLVLDPEHSLMKQSWAPREMRESALNADGFGFGWYTRDGEPAVYSSIFPIWNDRNLEGLGRALNAGVWLANVRSIMPGQEPGPINPQPFADGRVLFQHNGYIAGFRSRQRELFDKYLRRDIRDGIRGNADSDYLFAVFRQCLEDSGRDPKAALLRMIEVLPKPLDGTAALFNVIVCDGEVLLACRQAFNGAECPTLYYCRDHPGFPGAVVIASERFDESRAWCAVDPHTLIAVRNGATVERMSI